ncbi:hypothetical protein D3C83_276820 [compost metagenome]
MSQTNCVRASSSSRVPRKTEPVASRSPARKKKVSIAVLAWYFASRSIGNNRAFRVVLSSE